MLAALRSNTKIVLWIVVVAFVGFIFASWGRGISRSRAAPERGTLGRVDGVEITYRAFTETVRGRLTEYAQRTNTAISEATREAIREEAWNTMVADILIQNEIERLGIDVPDDVVFEMLWTSPPATIYNSPAFRTEEGQFDLDLYHREIQLHPERWEGVAQLYRETLKRQLLQQEIQSAAFVSENEVWTEYVAQNEKVSVKYAQIEPYRISTTDLLPTEEEIRVYFDENHEDFERPPTATLRLVRFMKGPSDLDEQDVVQRLQDLANAVREGEDFASLAEIYSEGPSGPEGGDLGYFRRGKMAAEFEEVAFSLPVGEVSAPVKTRFGYHIIQIEDKRGVGDSEEVHARHILMEIRASDETLIEIEEQVAALGEAAAGDGLEAAAAEAGFEVQTTPPFPNDRYIPMVGNMRPAVKLAFDSEPGTILGPYISVDSYYVFEVAERAPSFLPTFEQLASEADETGVDHPAQRALVAERQKERAEAIATQIATRGASGATLEEAADEHGYAIRESGLVSRRDAVPGIGRGTEFTGAAFGLRTGETSRAVATTTPERFYVMRVEEKVAADEEAFAAQEDQIMGQLLQRKRLQIFSSWLEGLMAGANIEDFRDMYF